MDENPTTSTDQPDNQVSDPVEHVSSPTPAAETPTNKAEESGQAGQDWQARHDELKNLYDQQLKHYNSLRGKLVTQGTEKNQLAEKLQGMEAKIAQMYETLTKATSTPYDPDQFMEELRTQGPKVFDTQIKKALEGMGKEYSSKLEALEAKHRRLQVDSVVKSCMADTKNYPDFDSLKQDMINVMTDLKKQFQAGLGGNPDDVDPEELVPYLYNEAKLRHSQEALKAAESHGAKKAAAELAKDANTAVASGGKTTIPQDVNLDKLTLDQEREFWIKKNGLAEY